jgi:hypothetical protein
MSDNAITKPKRMNNSAYESIAKQLLKDIELLEQQMDRDFAEAERLKSETQVIKAHTTSTIKLLSEQINSLARMS